MNLAEFVDWLSTQSVWLRLAVGCPFMVLTVLGGLAAITTTAGREDS